MRILQLRGAARPVTPPGVACCDARFPEARGFSVNSTSLRDFEDRDDPANFYVPTDGPGRGSYHVLGDPPCPVCGNAELTCRPSHLPRCWICGTTVVRYGRVPAAACVSGNGRIDGHFTYVKMGAHGRGVCAFCGMGHPLDAVRGRLLDVLERRVLEGRCPRAPEEFRRADGGVLCSCGLPYRRHKVDGAREWLRVLCDGSLVKL